MSKHRRIGRFATATVALAATATLPGIALVGTAEAAAPTAPPGGWDPIIDCESGGNPRAQNSSSSASGLYQMLDSTWKSLGGKGHAKDAPAAEQTRLADKLYSEQGLSPWTASEDCWHGKISKAHKSLAPVVHPKQDAPKPEVKEAKPEAKQPDQNLEKRTKPPNSQNFPAFAPPGTEYQVRAGDSLSKIAQEHGTTWEKLFQDNKDVVNNPRLIRPGQHLRVSKTVAPAAVVEPLLGSAPAVSSAPAAPSLADKLAGQLTTGYGGVAKRVAQSGHLIQSMFDVQTVGGRGSRSTKDSDHPTGHALDFMVDRATGDRIADFVLRNAKTLGVKYVIWRQRYNDGGGWERMENRGSATANHFDHVHVSFN